ncbi:MAG TPA: UvrD-helicase domain-containing protein [Gemmatimonadales bacterium]|nr:UvrD-helicase domain-containing protein [Gemmatimonadales bacterium]
MPELGAAPSLAAGLNIAQLEAAAHVHGPMLVLAGAGSGKTRVLTTRIAALISQHGVPPDRIFAVTFTNKAAGEMKGRVGALLRRDPAGLWIGTFHSLSARLLRRDAERLGFTRQFTIFDETDRLSVVKRLLDRGGHPAKLFPPKTIQAIISGAKNRLQSPESLAASATFDRVVQVAAEVYTALGRELKAQNAMDFDDLMLHPLTLLREHPDRLAYWQDRFAFVLVDEFQDTNRAQYQLVRMLGAHGNVFAVGDDDQAIYGWRGAEVKNMRDFTTDFPAVQVVKLEENYRSTQVVLDTANAVIRGNLDRMGKTLRTRRRGGEQVIVVAAADERDEAEWVARELDRRARDGDVTLSEMAVLYRTNALSRALEEAFRRLGVTYRVVGAISFYERREVKDLLAYLRLVANPSDDEAFLRAIAVPRRGIGDAALAELRELAEKWGKPLLATAAIADRATGMRPNIRLALTGFAALIERLRVMSQDQSPAAVLEEILSALNYEAMLKEEGPDGPDRWDNVRELLAGAAQWSEVLPDEEDGTTPLERFLAEAALLSAHDKIQGTEEGVTLMTLHTAKGLEWRVVVLAGLEDGLFPLGRAQETPDGLEEERRLFYVGVTRAKDVLMMTWARQRRRGGDFRGGIASRFLRDVPPGLVEERTTSLGGRQDWSVPRRPWGGGDHGGSWKDRAPTSPGRVFTGGDAVRQWGERAAATPEPEDISQDAPRYVAGERVRHRRFGDGSIVSLSGAGKDLKVRVKFDDEEAGEKLLVAAYAGLERVWEE